MAGAVASVALGAIVVTGSELPARSLTAVVAGPASGTLELRSETANLRVRGLPRPGPGRVHQVWVRRAGEGPQPTDALFDGARTVAVPARLERGDAVLVTEEPAGGSVTPTSAPLLRANIQAEVIRSDSL